MDATHQLSWIPDSFTELYRGQGGRLMVLVEELRARYELCEDLAQQVVPAAQALRHDDGLTEDDVLDRLEQALSNPDSGLREDEARWVVRRLDELLGWHR
jgi:hypothetical protein